MIRSRSPEKLTFRAQGRHHEIYWNPKVLRHYPAGIQWALGDYEAEVKNPAVN
jgi:hypothetical protein